MKDTIEKLKAQITKLEAVNKRAFRSGYVLACCNLVHQHDEPSMAHDVLSQLGITRAQVKALGLDDYDQKALREIECASREGPYKPEGGE